MALQTGMPVKETICAYNTDIIALLSDDDQVDFLSMLIDSRDVSDGSDSITAIENFFTQNIAER